MSINQSLFSFKRFNRFYAIAAFVCLALGLVLTLLSNQSSDVYSDGSSSYPTLSDCESANGVDPTDLEDFTCYLDHTESRQNAPLAIAGYVFIGLSVFAANLAWISRFLIMTTDSLLEGLGGNLSVVESKSSENTED